MERRFHSQLDSLGDVSRRSFRWGVLLVGLLFYLESLPKSLHCDVFHGNITTQILIDTPNPNSDTYSKTLSKPLSASKSLSNLPFPVRPELIPKLTASEPDPELNRYKVKAGQSLQDWEKAGWIWAGDPRGWAEWFVRFWGGRRCEDDERQVKRCECV